MTFNLNVYHTVLKSSLIATFARDVFVAITILLNRDKESLTR